MSTSQHCRRSIPANQFDRKTLRTNKLLFCVDSDVRKTSSLQEISAS
jgi:hypothetical protein